MERVDRRVMQIFDELRAQSDFSKRHYFLMDSVGMSSCDYDGDDDDDDDDDEPSIPVRMYYDDV